MKNNLDSALERVLTNREKERKESMEKGIPLKKGEIHNIETVSMCNLKCPNCPYTTYNRKPQLMTWKLFKKIADVDLKDTSEVILYLFNEPLLDKYIFKRIKYLRKKGIFVGLSTNGQLLNKEKYIKLINSDLNLLIIDTDSHNKEYYEKLRFPGKFEILKKNIENIFKENRKDMVLMFQVINFSQKDIKQSIKYWKKYLPDLIYIQEYCDFGGRNKQKSLFKSHGDICYASLLDVSIDSFGNVLPCCRIIENNYTLGNLTSENFKDIWNSDKLEYFRKNFKNIDCCKDCHEYEMSHSRLGPYRTGYRWSVEALYKLKQEGYFKKTVVYNGDGK